MICIPDATTSQVFKPYKYPTFYSGKSLSDTSKAFLFSYRSRLFTLKSLKLSNSCFSVVVFNSMISVTRVVSRCPNRQLELLTEMIKIYLCLPTLAICRSDNSCRKLFGR